MNIMDFTEPRIAASAKNKTALTGVCIMNLMLAAAYLLELVKGTRSLPSYLIFLALCIIPSAAALAAYFRQKDTVSIRYICTVGFAFLYGFVMFTTTTDMAFCYVIVIFVILIVYTDMKVSVGLGIYALIVNIARIIYLAATRGLTAEEITNAEIIIACILFSFLYTIMAVSRISQINKANINKADSDRTQSEELLQLTMKIAGSMSENIEAVSESTNRLRQSIAATQSAMEELTDGTAETSSAISVQQQQTENIDKQVDAVSTITGSLLSFTDETSRNLTEGKEVMQKLVQQVKVSESSGTLVAGAMNELKSCADEMQSIVSLISNVASQTSLLSLNASIEAARAGEAGRGFAVVASEISTLAGQTDNATNDISQLINNIAQSLGTVMVSVEELLQSNQLQNQYISSAAGYFDLIETNTHNIVSGMSELKQGVDTVAGSNKHIIESIENVSAVTEEVTAGANATLSDCRTNLENVEDIVNVMKRLQENEKELKKNGAMGQ